MALMNSANTTFMKNPTNNAVTEKLTGSKNSFANARPSHGTTNANVGPFDEQVNGVNVEGLFSVWAPNSQQFKLRQKQRQDMRNTTTTNEVAADPNTVYGSSDPSNLV